MSALRAQQCAECSRLLLLTLQVTIPEVLDQWKKLASYLLDSLQMPPKDNSLLPAQLHDRQLAGASLPECSPCIFWACAHVYTWHFMNTAMVTKGRKNHVIWRRPFRAMCTLHTMYALMHDWVQFCHRIQSWRKQISAKRTAKDTGGATIASAVCSAVCFFAATVISFVAKTKHPCIF